MELDLKKESSTVISDSIGEGSGRIVSGDGPSTCVVVEDSAWLEVLAARWRRSSSSDVKRVSFESKVVPAEGD